MTGRKFGEMLRSMMLASGLLLMPQVGQAKTVYECQFDQVHANAGWVPEASVIAFEPGDGSATLSDPYVLYVHDKPIEVPVSKETASRFTLAYELTLPTTDNDRMRVGYRLTVFKADLRATLTGRPLAADNSFSANGNCKKRK